MSALKETPPSAGSWLTSCPTCKGATQAKSVGVSPSTFHCRSRQPQPGHDHYHEQGVAKLEGILAEATTNVIRNKQKEVAMDLILKRAAFKDVTSLKTWPLQEPALANLDDLLDLHHLDDQNSEKLPTRYLFGISDTPDEIHDDSSGSSSCGFLDEPKRTRWMPPKNGSENLIFSSPRKSTLRHRYKHEFLREQDMPKLDDYNFDNSFLPPLWSMEPRIFALEKGSGGKRKYQVGHLGRFLDHYWRKVDPLNRHHYELIRENTPCRLYIDIEFQKAANPDISDRDCDQIMTELCKELQHEFHRLYGLILDRNHIVDLDSSTQKKFSRHWIVHLPSKHLFRDAAAVGRFMKVFVGRLANNIGNGSLRETRPFLYRHLFVDTLTPQQQQRQHQRTLDKTCIIDLGVYTRNRLFRLLASTKFGKPLSAALRIAQANEFPFPDTFKNSCFYQPAIEEEAEKLCEQAEASRKVQPADIQTFTSSIDFSAHANALADTLVVPANASKIPYPILDDSSEARALRSPKTSASQRSKETSFHSASGVGRRVSPMGVSCGSSPFTKLDAYVVKKLATRGGVQGWIRCWSINEDSDGLPSGMTYQMSRNRWCEFVKRSHKSNNIMWTVDFKEMVCQQGCHDPDCRLSGFRGTRISLPKFVEDEVREALFELALARVDVRHGPKPATYADKETSFDEEEFESALLGLKIDDVYDEAVEPTETRFSGVLSDADLEAAVLANPKLFP